MRSYEDKPYWVRKDDPTCVVRIREFNNTTSMWNPKADNHLVVQRLDKPVFDMEGYDERIFLKQFEEFIPPKPRVKTGDECWWRDRQTPAIFTRVIEVIPWQGPKHPVRVRLFLGGEFHILPEDEFLKRFERSGPPPDKKTAWGKVWDDD